MSDNDKRFEVKVFGGKSLTLTTDEFWRRLEGMGLGDAVRQLVNVEAERHNESVEKIVEASGLEKNPGIAGLCLTVSAQRNAALGVATAAEGLAVADIAPSLRTRIDELRRACGPKVTGTASDSEVEP